MIEVIIVSDNHGLTTPLELVKLKHPHADGFIHCGDSELSPQYLSGYYACTGNNDYYYQYPEYVIAEIKGIKFYITHGHQFYTNNRIEGLTKKAVNHHCMFACYGHTHVYNVEENNGVTLINPGSMRYNRDGTKPCYAQVLIDHDKITVNRCLVSDL
ncbi:hypothetical protein AOC36_07660 [Erysipelothrix larvae]|uniref:Phosphoesterase n=1 Tax=Erysipelothrix larvae TaxID=1514105 RepID=A0A0X8H0L3_9FIRM|nr:YfcE family phosphodiesterase [Erysipelothrix larvae]AMC93863.1 hypothetical protein AOC36_07660 [Erysipelothrix larvae]